jgi:amino acid adenylation domain-containing protein/thioester reductase-like protein
MQTETANCTLTHAEKRIYLTQVMYPESSLWNLAYSVKSPEPLDLNALEKAVNLVVERNDALRCTFSEADGELQKRCSDYRAFALEVIDFSLTGGEPAYVEWVRSFAAQQIWNNGKGPLFRCICARLSGSQWALAMKVHHIVADGSSAAILLTGIFSIYRALLGKAPLPEWQKTSCAALCRIDELYCESREYHDDREFWLKGFQELPEPLELFPQSQQAGLETRRSVYSLPAELQKAVYRFCEEHRTTPFRIVMAALYTWLARTTGTTDLVIGSAMHNRLAPELKDAVGMFVSTVPVRISAGLDVDFKTLLDAVRTQIKDISLHQRYPYDVLINDLRERHRQPVDLIKVMLVQYMNGSFGGPAQGEFLCHGNTVEPLTIYLSYGGAGQQDEPIMMMADWQVNVFTEERIESFFDHMYHLLSDALKSPDTKLHALELLSPSERKTVVHNFNAVDSEYPRGRTLHELFETQVMRTPNKTALVYREKRMTYAELNMRANRLARALRNRGAGKGSFVGVLVDRTMDMIVAALGVLKAGAAYMPIDPQYPEDRIRFMLEDSGAAVLVTQTHYLERMAFAGTVLDVDDASLDMEDPGNPEHISSPCDPSCLLYTSGSTGKPKGTILEHTGMVNFSIWYKKSRRITSRDRVAKHASFSFDVSIMEIYPTLFAGAEMHIISDDIRLSLNLLNEYYERNGITGCFFTTQLGEQFIEMCDNRSLRYLDVAGEKLRIFRERRYRINNGYGPTECTVLATDFAVDREYVNIPIGKPLSNYRIYILDRYGNPQPIGAPGEICIAGAGVARGYLNRPEKTAEVFVESPFVAGERMYLTGDLGRWLPDGNIEFLGRKDRQVKIRGFRIEPGEIEQALLGTGRIKTAAVVDKKDTNGRVYLCAYVTADEPLDVPEVKQNLVKTIPEYMVPRHIMQLEKLPLTPSGKIDRRALPEPSLEAEGGVAHVPPRNEREREMVRIWKEALNVDEIGIDDDFFALGGHSLKAVGLLAKMERVMGASVLMRDLFASPTIRELAEKCGSLTAEKKQVLLPAENAEWYPTSSPQRQLYILNRIEGIGVTYNVPVKMTLEGPLDYKRLSHALQQMLRRHEALRTFFTIVNGLPVQKIDEDPMLKMTIENIGEDGLAEAISDFVRPFNLERAPLFRVKLLRISDDRHCLLMDLHHIICDGISISIIFRELARLYHGEELSAPPVHFKDYVVWHSRYMESDEMEGHAEFWQNSFNGYEPFELVTDYPRTASTAFDGGEYRVVLEKWLSLDLRRLCAESGATLHTILLSAFAALLSRYSGQEDIVVGTSMAGRTLDEVSDMVGMFVNTVPVRCQAAAGRTFRAFVEEIKQTMLSIQEHQDYPLERVYDRLRFHRGPGRNPLFDCNFVLRNMELPQFDSREIKAAVEHIPTHTSKFDISLAAEERDGGAIVFDVEYRTSLYRPETVQAMVSHLVRLLESACASPDSPIGDLDIIYPDERKKLLFDFNSTATTSPWYRTAVEAFEKAAESHPDNRAVVAAGTVLSYRDLNGKANHLARLLRDRGMKADVIAAILADRSADTVVAMLAVLKAGGAYTCIDPRYPAERAQYIIDDSKAQFLLGKGTLLQQLSFEGSVVALDSLPEQEGCDESPLPSPAPESLAYVIYTSGSTGKPKGVMIEHRSMVNFLHWYTTLHNFTSLDRAAEYASFTFDASIAQVYAPLVSGAELHIIDEELRLSPPDLNAWFEEQGITHAHFPTQFAEQFMLMTENTSLKRLVVGGDSLRRYRTGPFRLTNEYGPSETTVASTAMHVEGGYPRVPIGRPADNTRIYILDSRRHPVPTGVPGELCIAGAGLARGYLNNPEMTEKKFVPDPFRAGEKMYLTGDRARWLPDGNIEFFGRLDFQVKIRGYRIEPGEIEQALKAYCRAAEAVVVARSDQNDGKYLCAYYTSPADVPPHEVKSALAKALPEYMVPSHFIKLDRMPLNQSGKIDRSALPPPELSVGPAERVLPRNETEERIARSWSRVLGSESFGVFDSFFDAGGDSLRSIALVAELQKDFQVKVNDIFLYPTVAEQALHFREVKDNIKKRLHCLKEHYEQTGFQGDREYLGLPQSRELLSNYRSQYLEYDSKDMSARRAYRHILLTGATGYLGIYLLRELLQSGDWTITVPVRASSPEAAERRIRDKYQYYFGVDIPEEYRSRITALASDLLKDRLGLDEKTYGELSSRIDCIVHSAANVKHYGKYEEFYESNVKATERLLCFALEGVKKDFHHISTTSVGNGSVEGREYVLFTECDGDMGQKTDHVYVRTKQLAEQKVREFRGKGVRASIYRCGNITFDSASGMVQENVEDNAFFQVIKSVVNLGVAPERVNERNISFVNESALAIVRLFDREAFQNEVFHISNPHKVQISEILASPELDLDVKAADLPDFLDFLIAHYDHEGFKAYIEKLMLHFGWYDSQDQKHTHCVIITDRTEHLLARLGFQWSQPEPGLVKNMIRRALRERAAQIAGTMSFSFLSGEECEAVARKARLVHVEDEVYLARESSGDCNYYLVLRGYLEISRRTRKGWLGTVRVVGSGETIGDVGLLDRKPIPVNLQAYGEALVLSLDAAYLRAMMEKSPRFPMGLVKTLAKRVDQLSTFFVNVE